jgi:hypothetical protein
MGVEVCSIHNFHDEILIGKEIEHSMILLTLNPLEESTPKKIEIDLYMYFAFRENIAGIGWSSKKNIPKDMNRRIHERELSVKLTQFSLCCWYIFFVSLCSK